MSYICGGNSPTSGNAGVNPVDLHNRGRQGPTVADVGRARVVPDLYRRAVDSTAAVALAALLYPAIAWAYRDERRKAGTR